VAASGQKAIWEKVLYLILGTNTVRKFFCGFCQSRIAFVDSKKNKVDCHKAKKFAAISACIPLVFDKEPICLPRPLVHSRIKATEFKLGYSSFM
jgi:hypothetical protein